MHMRERSRSWLAFALVLLLAFLIGANVWAEANQWGNTQALDRITTGMIGIFGTVLGFYFRDTRDE